MAQNSPSCCCIAQILSSLPNSETRVVRVIPKYSPRMSGRVLNCQIPFSLFVGFPLERKYKNLFFSFLRKADYAEEHIPASPETVKSNFAQYSHCYITRHRGHWVLSINSLPSPISVVLTRKPIQLLLDFVSVFYHHSCHSLKWQLQWHSGIYHSHFWVYCGSWKLGRTFWTAEIALLDHYVQSLASLFNSSLGLSCAYSKPSGKVS